MKNSKLRRILLTLACAVLLVSLSVGATLAYLTSKTEAVVNTFTAGKVNITLDEADVDEYGRLLYEENEDGEKVLVDRVMDNEYKLMPGHRYVKDPIVHVLAGSEECVVFVKVENELTAIENSSYTIAKQMDIHNWMSLGNNIWVYKGIVNALENQVDLIVFDYLHIKNDADQTELEGYIEKKDADGNVIQEGKDIKIKAYAVQADGLISYDETDPEAPMLFFNDAISVWDEVFADPKINNW